jgi:hypothetical protein
MSMSTQIPPSYSTSQIDKIGLDGPALQPGRVPTPAAPDADGSFLKALMSATDPWRTQQQSIADGYLRAVRAAFAEAVVKRSGWSGSGMVQCRVRIQERHTELIKTMVVPLLPESLLGEHREVTAGRFFKVIHIIDGPQLTVTVARKLGC